jgi:hypothetical protein
MSDDRLQRLRDLVARLEKLPESAERDRVLAEVRARAVDIDTGETPRAMLPVDEAMPLPPVNPAPSAPRRREVTTPYRPRPDRPISTRIFPLAPVTGRVEPSPLDERLCLEEPPAPAEQAPRPWEQGLRG